jgi:tetratricopeptide (TPR) repeat protein
MRRQTRCSHPRQLPLEIGPSRRSGRARIRALRSLASAGLIALALLVAPGAWADVTAELRFHEGVAAFGSGDYEAARTAFEEALESRPEDVATLRYLGLVARQMGQTDAAIAQFRRAIVADPEQIETRIELAETLLGAERNDEARQELEAALRLAPADARLRLYAGITAYRQRDLRDAVDYLGEAAELDADVAREANYYRGLALAMLGDLYASSSALETVESQSPNHPLGVSAGQLRAQMQPSTPSRIWYASATAGVEYDTNPTVASELLDPSGSVAGNIRLRGLVDAYRGKGFTLRAGYDGFFAGYGSESGVNQMTHVAKALVLYDYKIARFGLSYDYAHTWMNFSGSFRGLHVVEPTVNVRVGRFGITQGFYKFQYSSFDVVPLAPALDLDGPQNAVGVNQILPLSGLFTHARLGILWTNRDSEGTEFDYNGFEINAGGGMLLPWLDIELAAIYRFSRLYYENPSIFPPTPAIPPPPPGQGIEKVENVQFVSFSIGAPIWRGLSGSIAGTYISRQSQIKVLSYDRGVFGTYLTWTF